MSRDEVINDEVESQLSAMFDGELPTAECELLSRRIDRDENLRARWSRYALIGAAMRFEPVATARRDFAARVSTAMDRAVGSPTAARATALRARRHAMLWQSALAATLVFAVAGLSIVMLRNVTVGSVGQASSAQAGTQVIVSSASDALARARQAAAVLGTAGGPATVPPVGREPWSYVTPPDDGSGTTALRTELVDYIVAHSEYSTPLMRPDLLSALISGGEDGGDSSAVAAPVSPSTLGPAAAAAGTPDGTTPAAPSR